MHDEAGVLYVVATPIGNLDDISTRALDTLRSVAWIAAEDTRHSKRLLNHFGISTPLISLHEHNEQARIPQVLSALQAGDAVALISDAGTPLISDPGFQLLRHIREQGLQAIPIPGPSSVMAALSIAGLATDRFAFEGFLSAKTGARRERLQLLRDSSYTLVFFESSHRIQPFLQDLAEIFGVTRQALIAREMTKLFEQSRYGSLSDLTNWVAQDNNRCKGEFVIVTAGAEQGSDEFEVISETQKTLSVLLEELPLKQAVKIACKITGLKKNKLYEMALLLNKT